MPLARIRHVVSLLAPSLLLTAVAAWPLVVAPGKVAVGCDGLFSTWVLAWETHALTSGRDIADANIFWPENDTLFYGPAALGALPVFAPILLSTGRPLWAINATVLLCFTLTGVSLQWVVWRWTRSHAAGFVAAATLLTTPWVTQTFVPMVPHLAVFMWFPWIIFLASTDLARVREILALGALVVLQCLADLVYVAPAVLAPLACLAAIRLARPGSRRSGLRLGLVVVASTALLSPLLHGYAAVFTANPEIVKQTLWFDPHPARTLLPSALLAMDRPAAFRSTALFILLVGLAVKLARPHGPQRLLRSRAWKAAAFWVLAGFLLSLGSPIVLGSFEWSGPQAWLARWLPQLERLRVPSRLGIASLMGLSLLVGLAFAAIAARLHHALRSFPARARAWIVIGLALLTWQVLRFDLGSRIGSPVSMGRTAVATPPAGILAALRQVAGPLVEIPNGPMPRQDEARLGTLQGVRFALVQARAMYNSTFHWHPILNGYSSYFPPGFARRLALADRLPDISALAALVRETNLRFVWVHLNRLDARRRALWLAQTEPNRARLRPALHPVALEGDDLLFRVER